MSDLQDALDRVDEIRDQLVPIALDLLDPFDMIVVAARRVADPNLKAMGKVNYALSHNDYSEAELQSLFDAALTSPGEPKPECPCGDGR